MARRASPTSFGGKLIQKVQRVRIAYDADDAGDRAAQRDAERFRAHGVEVFRVKFPHGMDANEYACNVKPADKSLALLLNSGRMARRRGATSDGEQKRLSIMRPRPLFL